MRLPSLPLPAAPFAFLAGALRAIPAMILAGAWTASGAAAQGAEQCTSAVVAPGAGQGGRPMLWKNRDTDVLSNKVVFVKESPHAYLALVDADDASGRHAWAGLNDAGFAIMNTVAYNLPEKEGESRDMEGALMADALRTCATVRDFEALLRALQGPRMGCLTNFGVMDGQGHAFLYEVHNHGFQAFDAAAEPLRYLVNTNFARSGTHGKGAGYLRFQRATELLEALAPGPLTVRGLLRTVVRDTGNALTKQPTATRTKGLSPAGEPCWVSTRDSIDKSCTAAAVILVGKVPGSPGSRATFWILPGEPVTAVAIPLWVEAGRSPEALWKGTEAPLWRESWRIKALGRPHPEAERREYLDLTVLANREGTGYLPRLLDAEEGILQATEDLERGAPGPAPDPGRLAAFQDAMAARALGALSAVRP